MFNSLHVPQQQLSPLGSGSVKLHAAVQALRTAFAEIIDESNYTNADINDPYVSFALHLYSKYNNDVDFHNIMTFPLQLPPQLGDFRNLNPAATTTPAPNNLLLPGMPYIYPNETPFPFSLFPSFPYLPLGLFSPTLLNEDLRFERLCFLGASLLEYLIKVTLYQKEEKMTPAEIMNTVSSVLNSNSLTILCKAYNIDFNYKFIGFPVAPFKLFLAYFGKYYDYYLSERESKKEWGTLFKWMEQLLGYIEEDIEKEDSERHKLGSQGSIEEDDKQQNTHILSPGFSKTETPREDSEKEPSPISGGHEKTTKDEFKLQDLIQSVQQDLNQSVCSSVEIAYKINEHPNLQTGMFFCMLTFNGEDFSSASAVNKKLAKSGAALFAAIDKRIIKSLKRSYHDYWIKKYTARENEIKRAFSEDPRFGYTDSDAMIPSDPKSNDVSEFEEFSTGGSPAPTPAGHVKEKIVLSSAKEKVYAYYNSKFNIVPKYEFSQLGNAKFEARLFLGNKMVSSAIAASKKDASAKAAMQVIEQNIDAF